MPKRDPEAAHWLNAARAGSQEALGQALEACRGYLLLIAQRELDPQLQAKGGASDVVQETFLEAQRDFGQFRGESADELRAWLRRLLLNNLANFARHFRGTVKRKVSREVILKEGDSSGGSASGLAAHLPSPSRQAIAHEQAEAVEQALQKLPEDHQRVVLLRYREERSFDEIAALMGRSPNAVRKLWARAIERLQKEMDKGS